MTYIFQHFCYLKYTMTLFSRCPYQFPRDISLKSLKIQRGILSKNLPTLFAESHPVSNTFEIQIQSEICIKHDRESLESFCFTFLVQLFNLVANFVALFQLDDSELGQSQSRKNCKILYI